jgi:hypothetical protein
MASFTEESVSIAMYPTAAEPFFITAKFAVSSSSMWERLPMVALKNTTGKTKNIRFGTYTYILLDQESEKKKKRYIGWN